LRTRLTAMGLGWDEDERPVPEGPRPARAGGPGGPVRRLRFSPDGTKLAVLVRNETAVRIWDLASLRIRLAAKRLDWDEDERPAPEGRQE
jgi:hypothetical protein